MVVSLGSAIAATSDPAERWNPLFGGAYPSQGAEPKHPCPGGRAAFGVIVGLLVEYSKFYLDVSASVYIPFAALVVILLVKPYGLFGQVRIERV